MTTQDRQPQSSPDAAGQPTTQDDIGTGSESESTRLGNTAQQPSAESSPESETTPDSGPSTAMAEETPNVNPSDEKLIPQDAAVDFKARWEAIQQGFVDDPRSAVTDADGLVGDVLQKLSATFEEQHRQLEGQWSDGEPDTEQLRSALQRYRDFFDRLLTL